MSKHAEHIARLEMEVAELLDERDRLRELVAELYRFADFGCEQRASCEGCPMFGDEHPELCGMSAAYRSIRELEVPL